MPLKPERHLFEYAIIRYVPSVERGEYINVGLVMMCKRRRWLRCRLHLPTDKIEAIFPETDIHLLARQLEAFSSVANGDTSPIGTLDAHERFRWLTAVRSASITTSRPHPGTALNLETTFDTLFTRLVL